MYESLANFTVNLPPELVHALYLEDIALCAAWYESHEGDSTVTENYGQLRQIFDHWIREVQAPRTDTEGYRQQPLLRDLITILAEGHVERLARDELDLLYFAVAFARRSGKLDVFRRVLSCTAPHMNSIEHVRKLKSLTPGCPNLGKRLAVATEEDIKNAEPRDVRAFGGISLPIRGPVYKREGHLKIMCGIPAGHTVAVDKGCCCVRGNVEGNLAATESCDILDNISGVVIARRGTVNARDIVNMATVISKEDGVNAINAETPKQVFAAREIHLKGNATGGRYLARKVIVEGDMCGGDLFVSERAEAANFIATDERPLRVCLVRGLSCQDYGEVLSAESSMLLNSAMKLRQRLSHMEELGEISEREADEYAGNVLLYVLGEDDTKERVQQIQRGRRKLSFLDRLTSGIHALVAAAEDRINNCGRESGEASGSGDDQATLDDLRRELADLANEGSIEPQLYEEKEEIIYLGRKLQRRGMERQGLQQVMERLLAKQGELQERAETLSSQLRGEERRIERAMGREALLERARAECSRVEMLKQLAAAARKRPDADIFKQRLNDRYIKVLQRTMENRNSRGAGYRSTCRELHERIEHVRERLWNEYMVSLPDHVLQGWAVGGARIEGRFSAGILICPWRHLMDDPSTGRRSFVITAAADEIYPPRQVFLRTAQSTIEDITPPEPDAPPADLNV